MSQSHPMQLIEFDKHGVIRFKQNAIVRYLLDAGGLDMNALVILPFSDEDFEQFYQLIGYSVSGFGDLEVSPETVATADAIAEQLSLQRKNRA